ncbi:hypothetical protein LDENG_00186070, partial [Lucifuga dentata]
ISSFNLKKKSRVTRCPKKVKLCIVEQTKKYIAQENMQTLHRKELVSLESRTPSCCEATELTTEPPYHPTRSPRFCFKQ